MDEQLAEEGHFSEATFTNPSIIVVHNHPSGDPVPSSQDIMITRQINQAAEMMDIELLDHIIIGGQNHLSTKNKGLGFRVS
jgi:DNA repair protein RadC